MDDDELYPCVGICMVDDTSGLCMGCGRPVQEAAPDTTPPPATDAHRQATDPTETP